MSRESIRQARREPLYGYDQLCSAELELGQDGKTVILPCEKLAHDPTERHEWWTGKVAGAPYAEVWWFGVGRTSFNSRRET